MSSLLGALTALLLATPMVAPPSPATEVAIEAEVWRIVPASSRVQFRVRLFGVVPVSGSFPAIEGAITIDAAARRARVDADVDAREVRMRRRSHAAWARSSEFFDADAHPQIRFESDAFPLARLDGGGAIQGRLTVRGITRPAAFTIEHARCEAVFAPRRKGAPARRCQVELAGAIDRSAFGMRTRGGTLANRVSLRFLIEAAAAP
ncbi:MAG TPA: YceI family protein [Candidatus Saccharimonadia bacterium]|nr:YceI family protein [Candidatus Saccharimonadia bacterium]